MNNKESEMGKNKENREKKMVVTATEKGVGFEIAGTEADILKMSAQIIAAIYKTTMRLDEPGKSGCDDCEDREGCEDKDKYPNTAVRRADAVMMMALSLLMSDIPEDSYFEKQQSKIRELLMGFVVEDMLGMNAG